MVILEWLYSLSFTPTAELSHDMYKMLLLLPPTAKISLGFYIMHKILILWPSIAGLSYGFAIIDKIYLLLPTTV